MIGYDFRQGIGKHRFYLAAIPVFLILALLFAGMGSAFLEAGILEEKVSFGDALLYCIQGLEPLRLYEEKQPFRIPIFWMALFLGSAFSVVGYAEERDLYGQQVFIRSRKRRNWWLSKCLWNICTTAIYFGIGLLLLAAAGYREGWEWSEKGTPGMAVQLFGKVIGMPEHPPELEAAKMVLTAVLCSMAWNLFQMYLALYLKSFVSFLVTVGMLASSIYFSSPLLLGNYMMAMRNEQIFAGGMKAGTGLLLALALAMWAVFGGLWKMKRYDYLVKED